MNNFVLLGVFVNVILASLSWSKAAERKFDENYYSLWGNHHLVVTMQGNQAELLMDQSSGAGLSSKLEYGSGLFKMRMKLPNKASKGVITTFYLTSKAVGQKFADHDELDFEFMGSNGMPYTLSTNVITNKISHREQQFHLWFDPTADFHTYQLLWNQHHILFFVDDIPIRRYKNMGVNYLSRNMHIEGTIWNNTGWVGPVDWSHGPFTAYFQGFNIDACPYQKLNPSLCYASTPAHYWNSPQFSQLSHDQVDKYLHARKNYMFYDYCSEGGHTECGRKADTTIA